MDVKPTPVSGVTRVVRPPSKPVQWLYDLQHFGVKLGLDNIRALLELLGRPDRAYPCLLVGGTNGKGSVASMAHSVLCASGLQAGLFTSPHLVRPTERIRIGRDEITAEEFDHRLVRMREVIEAGLKAGDLEEHPSFFEVVTATALDTFREAAADAAVLEVGLGGRLDATNAVDAAVSVIVSVDLDHTKTLGATLEAIAREKAGIIKVGRPLVSGVVGREALDVLEQTCAERRAPLVDARGTVALTAEHDGAFNLESRGRTYVDLRPALAGRHQIDNTRVAVAALETFLSATGRELDAAALREGLASVRWPGRLQWVRGTAAEPDMLFDGAHNTAGVGALCDYLAHEPRRCVALFGAMTGKPLPEMLSMLSPRIDGMVITRPGVRRSAEPGDVAAEARRYIRHVEVVDVPAEAFVRTQRLAGDDRFVLVTGSLYLVGEILGLLESDGAPGPVSM